jgi:PadR family transcriptional regulator
MRRQKRAGRDAGGTNLLLTIYRSGYTFLLTINRRSRVTAQKAEVLQGTLDLIVLKTLDTMGPMHGYGIARRIEQVSRELLSLNQGTLYPALLRLQQRGWITSAWGASENNRKAKYYSLTRAGKKQLAAEAKNWEQIAAVIARFLRPGTEGTR